MPTEHSNVMGGSTAEQRIYCPLSYTLEQRVPKRPDTEFSKRGSMLHSAVELIIVADPEHMAACEFLFDELEGQDLGYEEMEITRELIDTKLRPAMEAWFELRAKYDFVDWFIEQRVSLESQVEGAFGTADILAIDADENLHVLDWKFGDGVPVPVEGNYGAGFYAAAAMYDEDPELVDFTETINKVILHIVQPRANFPDEQALQTWETTEEWVEELVDLAINAIDKARGPNPPAQTGKWCRWCDAKTICPEYGRVGDEALATKPEMMTAVELSAAMHKADLLKEWCDAVYRLAQQEMERGVAVPEYKLVQKQSRRSWIDPAAAEKAMRKAKIKVADMFKKTLISPAQAQKLDKDLYSNTLCDLVQSKSSGLTVVPDTDKRPAFNSGANLLAEALGEKSDSEKLTVNSKR